jgi:hypothetical protein
MKLIGYPEGNILKVNNKEFDLLNDNNLVMFDDEWTEDTPNGQWGFNCEDEKKIKKLLKSAKN